MKKIVFILLSLQSLVSVAQSISYRDHCLVPSDSVIKRQVTFKDPGASGRNLEWDYRNLQTLTDSYILTYKGDLDSLCGREHRTRYYYSQTEKSVVCKGFETSDTYIQYNIPLLELSFPLNFGDTLSAPFSGIGEHGQLLQQEVRGQVRITADATGTLQLPEEILKTIRVKTEAVYSMTGRDSSRITKETYRWYANGYRYPVFESVRIIYKTKEGKDSTAMSTSFLYSLSYREQRKRETENAKAWFGDEYDTEVHSDSLEITEMDIYPNPVADKAYIRCIVSRQSKVVLRVCSASGAVVYESSRFANEGDNEWQVLTDHLSPGSYVAYAETENGSGTSTVMLKK